MKLYIGVLTVLLILHCETLSSQFKVTEDNYHYIIDRYNSYLGKSIPNLTLLDANGKVQRLYDVDSKLIILDLWATWCSPCIKGFPITNGVYDRLKSNGYSDIELIYLAVDQDTTRWKNMVMTKEMSGISLLAGQKNAKDIFHINGLPCYFLLDREKNIIGHDIQKPNENGGLMEFTICQVYNGNTAGEAFQNAFEKGDDGYYYPSQKFKAWDETYINIYDNKE